MALKSGATDDDDVGFRVFGCRVDILGTNCKSGAANRPLCFISLSHSDNQSESTTKFYNSSNADVVSYVLTLTSCLLRSDRAESVWMPTELVKFGLAVRR